MDNFYQIGIEIILALQGLGDWLFPIMKFFTFLGDEEFYLLVTPVLYWCIDTSIGIRTAMMLMFSSSLYNYGKWLFHSARPYWYSRTIRIFRSETSFGMPSGHSTNAVTIWGYLAYAFKKKWFWFISVTIMIMVGLSRIVLAVHFPHDVLLGWTLGIVTLLIFIKGEPLATKWLQTKTPGLKIALSFSVSLLMILIAWVVLLPLKSWSLPLDWQANSALAFPNEPQIDPTSISGEITLAGTFLGLTIGHILSFSSRGYSAKGVWWRQLVRYLIGIIGVFSIWAGLDQIFPEGNNFIPLFFRYIRYALVGFWITYLGPKLFILLKLSEPSNKQR